MADAITNNKLLYASPLNLDYKALLKQLKKDDKLHHQQMEAGGDPEKDTAPDIPKVKMSRADDNSTVVRLLEHFKDASTK
jgi:hypothetical protein